ncbi:MAG: FMN-binding protein [Patescibacteria group bacterium]
MSNKKTVAVSASALAALALVGCNKEEAQVPAPVPPVAVTPSVEINPAPVAAPALVSTGTNAAPAAVSGSERTVEFNQPYSLGTQTAYLKGRMVLENGIVKSVEVPGAQGPQATFAAGIGDEAYGKPVKGLQIDTISGASLTTAAFNEFLKTVE